MEVRRLYLILHRRGSIPKFINNALPGDQYGEKSSVEDDVARMKDMGGGAVSILKDYREAVWTRSTESFLIKAAFQLAR